MDGRILACTLAALMPSPKFSLTSRKLPNARWRLASDMPLCSLRLNAVEAPDPKEAIPKEQVAGNGVMLSRRQSVARCLLDVDLR